MKRLILILALVALTPALNTAQKPKYPYNHVFHASVNTTLVYAEAYNGSTTADMVNQALHAYPAPAQVLITPGMPGTSCDFTGITLTSDQYSLVDLRQGKIAWGFKDPGSNNIICEVQSGSAGTFIDTLTVNNFNGSGGGTNGLISGGAIYYAGTGFNYTVTRATYSLGGVLYTSPQTDITLAASDPTNPRIDVVSVDNSGSVGVITGTPAPAPSQPSIDPTTQIQLGFITVPAASTSPTGTSTENIYLEDAGPPAEWGCATSGTGWNCADTTHPYAGTKDIQSLGTDASSYVHLTRSAAEDVSSNNLLFLQLRTEKAWHGKWEVWMTFYDGSTPVGNTVFAQNNSFGWNGKSTGAYQLVGIPLSSFNLSSSSVDGLRIKWNDGGTSTTNATIYLDNIQLQQNGVQGGGTGGGGSASGLSNVILSNTSTFFPDTLPCSTAAGVENCDVTPSPAPPGTVWAGPLGASATNVAVRQVVKCEGTEPSFTCVVPGAVSGDFLIIPAIPEIVGSFQHFSSITDSFGTSFTATSGGSDAYAYGLLSSSGSDTISITTPGSNPSTVYIYEVAGAASILTANSVRSGQFGTGTGSFSHTNTVTQASATDGTLNIFLAAKTTVPTASMSLSPTSQLVDQQTAGNGSSTESAWISAAGSTSAVGYKFSGTASSSTNGNVWSIVFAQSGTAVTGTATYKPASTVLSNATVRPIQSTATFTIGSAVNLPSATDTTVLSGAVTMPSTGCPCRALVQSGIFLNSTTSAQWGWWASDGTNTFGWGASITTDAHTPPVQIANTSPVAYSNGQVVTFSIVINPGTYSSGTVQALSTLSPPLPAAAHSWMTVTVIPSVN